MDRSLIFLCFLFLNFLACSVNHIDDTDETYGYWEPLHYLLNGIGMQTWEYSPTYAIRTYAFIIPFQWFANTLKRFSLDGPGVFLGVRLALATVNAVAQSGFVSHVRYKLGPQTGMLTMAFMLSSPGLFYSMTSFLPSSIAASFVMFAFSAWLEDHFFSAIAYGSVAVLCTGWPFVGLLLLPVGAHMLLAAYFRKRHWGDVVALCFSGATIVISVAAPPFLIDSHMYNK